MVNPYCSGRKLPLFPRTASIDQFQIVGAAAAVVNDSPIHLSACLFFSCLYCFSPLYLCGRPCPLPLPELLFPPDPVFTNRLLQRLFRCISQDFPGTADIHRLCKSKGTYCIAGERRFPGQSKKPPAFFQPSRQCIHQSKGQLPVAGFLSNRFQKLLQNLPKGNRLSVCDIECLSGRSCCSHRQFTGLCNIFHTRQIYHIIPISKKGNTDPAIGPQKPGHQTCISDANQPSGAQYHCLQSFGPSGNFPFRHQFGPDIAVQIILLWRLSFADLQPIGLLGIDTGRRNINQTFHSAFVTPPGHFCRSFYIGFIKVLPSPPYG